MAYSKHTIHAGIAKISLAAVTGDAFAIAIATGRTTGIDYWLGASAQRRHG